MSPELLSQANATRDLLLAEYRDLAQADVKSKVHDVLTYYDEHTAAALKGKHFGITCNRGKNLEIL